ncbi:DUF2281 domain-containing protein [Dyadobacter sp. CY107]|uniref:DUF2281 domain-containing protein n=1 Tax=Dyadobacter fanqingshengii TaxID=2906443 RepID=UPI001F1C83B8|nr:DUF2281 domain-containing protein [Dyadobacter fanqingshengii]MCF2504834.1 DUF2281 domain-containing protein [Dyadobacter fanqingshengii]
MLTVIEGTYENGQVILDHKPKVENKTKVVVIFEEIEMPTDTNEKRPFGISKGNITLSPDFNEPLDDLKDYM